MINCNCLGYNEKVLFGTIVEEKNNPGKTTLRRITNRVFNNYDQYLNRFPTLEVKTRSEFRPAETDEKSALQLCYSSATDTFKYIRGKIFSTQSDQLKALCPYCLLDKPKTLDHYIGQTEFPEYSILLRNLIPCCYDCNQKKGETWRKNKHRRFIHFYNDNFIQNRFLYARLIYPRGSSVPEISYYLSKPSVISIGDFKIVKFHFKDLALIAEYNSRANALISSEVDVLKKSVARGTTKPEIVHNLTDKFNSISADFGVNYWTAVMYETMASNSRLIRSL